MVKRGGNSSISNAQPGVNTNGSSTAKPKFDPVALTAKANTIEQLEALPEYKQLEAWIKPYLDRINNKTVADLNTYEKKLQYAKDFQEVYYARVAEKDVAMGVMIKAATQGRSLDIPSSDKSWAEMSDYVEFRSRISDQLQAQYSKLDRFYLQQAADLLNEQYVQEPKTDQDRDINTAIAQIYENLPDLKNNNMYHEYRNRFGGEVVSMSDIAAYVDGRFAKDNNYPSVVKSIRDVMVGAKAPTGRVYEMAQPLPAEAGRL